MFVSPPLGGVSLFGFEGFVFGPGISGMCMAAWGLLAGSRKASPCCSVLMAVRSMHVTVANFLG